MRIKFRFGLYVFFQDRVFKLLSFYGCFLIWRFTVAKISIIRRLIIEGYISWSVSCLLNLSFLNRFNGCTYGAHSFQSWLHISLPNISIYLCLSSSGSISLLDFRASRELWTSIIIIFILMLQVFIFLL